MLYTHSPSLLERLASAQSLVDFQYRFTPAQPRVARRRLAPVGN